MAGQTLTFTLEGRDRLSRILDGAGNSAGKLEAKLALASAAIPAAAALAPLIAHTGAAAVAVAAFGAAVIPQVAALGEASKAQKKYEDAVSVSGARSKEAITAQVSYQRTMAKMPPATQEAAMGLSLLTGQYKDWSNATAKDTMPAVNKGFAIMGGLLPKLTPMVKGVGTELDRTMTLAGGGMQTPGFDRVTAKFADFANGSLKSANDGLVHLSRTLDTGKVGGGFSEFMDFAQQQGPLVGETLRSIALAALNVLEAASSTGIGVLQLANALAKVVGSLPPEFLTLLFQAALAIRGVSLAIAGVQLVAGGLAWVRVQIAAMGTAALGSSTMMGSLRLAFLALSRTARIAVASTGIGLLLVALGTLSQLGKSTPPDVDKLTTSLGELGRSGKVGGEAARAFGTDLGGLADSLRIIARPSVSQGIDKWIGSLVGIDTREIKNAKVDLDAIDEALAGLVRNGQADLAAAALKRLGADMGKGKMSAKELNAEMDKYKSALADAAFEQQLAADAMGLFGDQAIKTKTKLDEQKASADGLRQAIFDLNNVNRGAYDAETKFQAAIDNATKAIGENGRTLDAHTEAGRGNRDALSGIASAGEALITSLVEQDASWETVSKKTAETRSAYIAAAMAAGKTKAEASALANQLVKMPDKKVLLKANADDLTAKVKSGQKNVDALIQKRKTAVGANKADLDAKIKTAQRQLDTLKQKQSAALRAVDNTGPGVRSAKAALGSVKDKNVRINILTQKTTHISYTGDTGAASTSKAVGQANGGIVRRASGGPVGFPGGGHVRGPGTSTSDSIATFLSDNEYVVKAKSVAKYGLPMLDALNDGRLEMGAAGPSGGAMAGAGADAGHGLASGLMSSLAPVEKASRAMAGAVVTGVRAELEIASPSKKTKALAADAGKGMIIGLTGSKAKISATAKDLVKDIWAAWKGSKSTKDSKLVAMVNRDTAKLQSLATKRDALASKIATAKKYASDLTMNARTGAQLSNLGIAEGEVTAGSIQAGLAQKLAQIKTFTAHVKLLAAKGLNKDLLQQILNMGPDQGYAYASALAGAGASTIASINSTRTQISTSTDALGKTGADMMYDSGAMAGKGFLTGLTSQQKAIEAQMVKIARGMQTAIKKALGIKSPSRVMAGLGRYSTEGLAMGLTERMPVLDRALATVSGRVAATRPVMGAAALPAGAMAGGGGAGTTVNIRIDGAIDPLATARQIQKLLLQLKRTHGVNINLGVS